MTFPLVISFYTAATAYEQEAQRLRRSCDRFGLPLHLEALASTGRWVSNCALKGPFVLRCLERFQRPVLWLDADAEVVAYPVLFERAAFEFAAYMPGAMLSGTLYFAWTAPALALATDWAQRCRRRPRVWDQRLLQEAYEAHRQRLVFRPLPQGYCRIFDRPWREAERRPYVVHHQASRRLKRSVARPHPPPEPG